MGAGELSAEKLIEKSVKFPQGVSNFGVAQIKPERQSWLLETPLEGGSTV